MIKLLDRYIINQFVSKFIGSMIAFLTIFIIVDVIDHLDKFIDTDITRNEIFKYYFHTLPWYISIGMPMALLLSTVFSLGLLQKRNELTAIKASGISLKRVTISLILIGFLSIVFSFYFENLVVAPSMHKRAEIELEYFQSARSKRAVKSREIYRQVEKNKILYTKRFNFKTNTAHNISLQTFENNNILSRLDAPTMSWDESTEKWRLPVSRVRTDLADDNRKFQLFESDSLLTLDFTPVDLTAQSVKPEEMNYWELDAFVDRLNINGIKDPRWVVNLHFKPAFAFSSFIMILFGLSLSVQRPRSSMAVGLGVSIFVIFLYYGAIKFGQSMGYKGMIEPWLSVWLGNFIFLLIGGYMFMKTKS
ncbi:MAG: YjgP/YjgQ family permease [Candidatus Marinimicrobia bacterium]|nr:YjgP/YjgQ family permease [Candidatus Neomarinimicrobiota bacterium]